MPILLHQEHQPTVRGGAGQDAGTEVGGATSSSIPFWFDNPGIEGASRFEFSLS